MNLDLDPQRPRAHSVPNIQEHVPRPSRLGDISQNQVDRDFIAPINHDQEQPPHHMGIPHYPGFRPIITYQPIPAREQQQPPIHSTWENMHAYRDYPILGLILLMYENYPQLTLASIAITAGVAAWNYDKIIEFYKNAKDRANTLFLKMNSPKKTDKKKIINEHDRHTNS